MHNGKASDRHQSAATLNPGVGSIHFHHKMKDWVRLDKGQSWWISPPILRRQQPLRMARRMERKGKSAGSEEPAPTVVPYEVSVKVGKSQEMLKLLVIPRDRPLLHCLDLLQVRLHLPTLNYKEQKNWQSQCEIHISPPWQTAYFPAVSAKPASHAHVLLLMENIKISSR